MDKKEYELKLNRYYELEEIIKKADAERRVLRKEMDDYRNSILFDERKSLIGKCYELSTKSKRSLPSDRAPKAFRIISIDAENPDVAKCVSFYSGIEFGGPFRKVKSENLCLFKPTLLYRISTDENSKILFEYYRETEDKKIAEILNTLD